MFKRVLKRKGGKMALYVGVMAIVMLVLMSLLMWFMIADEFRNWEYVSQELHYPQLILVMVGFMTLVTTFISYGMMKSEVEAEDRVARFSKLYKVGDKFWALHRQSEHLAYDPKRIRDCIFHFKVEEINFKKTYFKLSEENRSGWSLSRSGMSDYFIFKSDDAFHTWLDRIKSDYAKDYKKITQIVEDYKSC